MRGQGKNILYTKRKPASSAAKKLKTSNLIEAEDEAKFYLIVLRSVKSWYHEKIDLLELRRLVKTKIKEAIPYLEDNFEYIEFNTNFIKTYTDEITFLIDDAAQELCKENWKSLTYNDQYETLDALTYITEEAAENDEPIKLEHI